MSIVEGACDSGQGSNAVSSNLIRSKAGYLSEVRRREKVLKEALNEEIDPSVARRRFEEYEAAFRNFMTVHEKYLEVETDEERRNQAIHLYELEQNKRLNFQVSISKGNRDADNLSEKRSQSVRSSVSTRSSVRERKRVIAARLKLKALEEKHDLMRKEAEIRNKLELLEAKTDAQIAEECLILEEELDPNANIEVGNLCEDMSQLTSNVVSSCDPCMNGTQVSYTMNEFLGRQISSIPFTSAAHEVYSTSPITSFSQAPVTSTSPLVFLPSSISWSSGITNSHTQLSNSQFNHARSSHTPMLSGLSHLPLNVTCAISRGLMSYPVPGEVSHNGGWLANNPILSTPAVGGQQAMGHFDTREPWMAIAEAIRQGPSLPKLELLKFSGDPKEYVEFITNFKTNIESKVYDPSQRLTRLLAQCNGKAREAIRSCVNLPPDQGYNEALRTLHDNFGLPHMVSDAQLSRLREIKVRHADSGSLMTFARILEEVWRVLSSMGPVYSSRLNNEEVIKILMRKLPSESLKRKWAERAGDLILRNGNVNFLDFIEFVKRLGARLNNMYGQELMISQPKEIAQRSKVIGDRNRVTTLSTGAQSGKRQDLAAVKRYPPCVCCSGPHGIWKCENFKKLNYKDKLAEVRKNQLCNLCLGKGHYIKNCRSGFTCRVQGCGKKHHTLIHPPEIGNETHQLQTTNLTTENTVLEHGENINVSAQTEMGVSVAAVKANSPRICFKVVPVKVRGIDGNKEIETYAFLDSGSDKTLCLKQLIRQLNVPSKSICYDMSTANSKNTIQGEETSICVSPLNRDCWHTLADIWTTESIPVTEAHFASAYDLKEWPHLGDVDMPEIESKDVMILIGNDHPELVEMQLSFRKGGPGEPIAIETPLGWTVCGPIGRSCKSPGNITVNFAQVSAEEEIRKNFERLYDSEFLGAINDEKDVLSAEDKEAAEIMEKTLKLVNGHFEVGLPFRNRDFKLPDSFPVAHNRLIGLKKRFNRDPVLKEQYSKVMKGYEEEGSARRVTEEEVKHLCPKWYLPHRAVWHPRKPGEPRVVFDCAAKSQGVSLNDCLLKGPENTSSLIGVLLRFRLGRIGVAADIKRMFHQVFVTLSDRGALCYLWWPDGDLTKEPATYQMLVHIFGATSSPSVCGFALRNVAEAVKDDVSQKTIDALHNSFYVDDLLQSFEEEREAVGIIEELRSILKEAGFCLTKFTASSREVLESVPKEHRSQACKDLELNKDSLPSERALGVCWEVEEDLFKVTVGPKKHAATRRGILSSIASVYDPLGFASPLVLPGRQLNQELCRLNFSWDEPLPCHIIKCWDEWKQGLGGLDSFGIPRSIKPVDWPSISHIELHHFSDASEHHGYGTVSYLRFSSPENKHFVSFLFGKSRVKPLRSGITVPKLELTAASVLVSVHNMLMRELEGRINIDDTVFWTDSIIVLRYIRNETRRFSQFVANRVAKIKESSQVSQWRHVRSQDNPADLASRGMRADEHDKMEMWKKGPEFLWQDQMCWPAQPAEIAEELSEEDEGVKKEKVILTVSSEKGFWSDIFKRYSSWCKLRRVVAWVQRAVRRFKKAGASSDQCLTVEELLESERLIVKAVQASAFGDVQLLELKRGKGALVRLQPVIEAGIIRVGGRLSKSTLPYDFKHPMIIPANHDVTRLLIHHYHTRNGHSGAQQTLSEVRRKFWVISGLATVKREIRKCHECRRQLARVGEQITAPLPLIRVSSDIHGLIHVFSAVGTELFGPLMTARCRRTRASKITATNKRYGCIFTCLRYRAVHLELLNDLSTDSFINAVTRFVSRRGAPRIIVSDNGSNFKGAEKEVRQAMETWSQGQIQHTLAEDSIKWEFNPPGASHQGGVWERLIRSVRRILHSLLRETLVDDETLRTFLCEVEKILNDRPITKLSDDPRDERALTPNDILLLRRNLATPPREIKDQEMYQARWKYVHLLANRFWQRWVLEYLPTLQERQKWLKRKPNFQVGDLVLIADKGLPRGQWTKGLIETTFPDSDGDVRRVVIRTANGNYTRDIRKICLLEENIVRQFEEKQ